MTWTWDVDGTELKVWDHTQDPGSDAPYRTLTNADKWPAETPFRDVVLDVMHDDCIANIEGESPANQRALWVLLDAAFERIERRE